MHNYIYTHIQRIYTYCIHFLTQQTHFTVSFLDPIHPVEISLATHGSRWLRRGAWPHIRGLGVFGELIAKSNIGRWLERWLTWHLKIDPWKRRFLLETTIFRFHVNLPGFWSNGWNHLIWATKKNWLFTTQVRDYTLEDFYMVHLQPWAMKWKEHDLNQTSRNDWKNER